MATELMPPSEGAAQNATALASGKSAAAVEISRRKLLQTETGALHQQLDSSIERRGMLHTREGYAQFLAVQARLHLAIEGRLAPLGRRLLSDWAERGKVQALRDDLALLGVPMPEPLSAESLLEDDDKDGAMLGILYVSEGSTLGGAVLAPMLEKSLGVTAEQGARFLNIYGDKRGLLWRHFLEALERCPLDSFGQEAMLRAANRTFHILMELFDGVDLGKRETPLS